MKAIFLILFLAGNASAQTSIVTDFGITKAVGDGAYVLKTGDVMSGPLQIAETGGLVTTPPSISFGSGFTGDGPSGANYKLKLYNGGGTSVNGFSSVSSGIHYGAVAGGGHLFYTGNESGKGTEKMRVASTGNVGIGNTNPDTKLHVSSGTIKIDGTGSPSAGYALCLTATKQIGRCSDTPTNGACTCAVN